MALTDTNKADIRLYMGYSARFHNSDSILEFAIDALDSDPEAETIVLGIIVDLQAIDTRIDAVYDRLKATKVCEIEVAGCKEIKVLRSEGRRKVGRMASTLGCPVRHDAFSSSSYRYTAKHTGLVAAPGNFGPYG